MVEEEAEDNIQGNKVFLTILVVSQENVARFFGGLLNKKYVANIQNYNINLSV